MLRLPQRVAQAGLGHQPLDVGDFDRDKRRQVFVDISIARAGYPGQLTARY